MTKREERPPPAPEAEAMCFICQTPFTAKLLNQSERPLSVTYEGHCECCGGYAILTYVVRTEDG